MGRRRQTGQRVQANEVDKVNPGNESDEAEEEGVEPIGCKFLLLLVPLLKDNIEK